MLTKTIKWVAIATLIGGAQLRSTQEFFLLQLLIVAASVVVLPQAANMRRYVWGTLFLVIACLFNPVFRVPFSNYGFGISSALAALLFFFSLELRPRVRQPISSSTGRVPDRESL
jgi:hypothetical protein